VRTAVLPILALTLALALSPSPAPAQITLGSPSWSQLTPKEREILAPLQSDWDQLDAQRKSKWRGIAQRYPKMKPDEQQRIHDQMKGWAELTPQQRATAREQYKSMNKLPPDKQNEVRQRWQEYQSLPPEQKREFATQQRGAASAGSARQMAPPMTPPPQMNAPADAARTR